MSRRLSTSGQRITEAWRLKISFVFDLPYLLRLPADRRIKISSDGMSFLLSCKNADSLKVHPWIELGENEIASIVFEHADERFVFDSSTLRSTVAIDAELDLLDTHHRAIMG